ncbi:NADPH-dependent FMN reductase [Streptomyces sp. NPDC001276]|uniref:NADPH-dependent FMN reductase n=1 Tax=Streptomyces sp. NPDC001276 TaxID=3364555 RepID=UPI0036C70A18
MAALTEQYETARMSRAARSTADAGPRRARGPTERAVIGASPGAIGTAIAQQSLRSVLSYCNSPQMNAPEAYIKFSPEVFTEDGQVTNSDTEEFLRRFMEEFRDHIVRVLSVLPPRET